MGRDPSPVPEWVTKKVFRGKKSHHKTLSTQSNFFKKAYFFVCLCEGECSFPTSFFPVEPNPSMRFCLLSSVCTGMKSCATVRTRSPPPFSIAPALRWVAWVRQAKLLRGIKTVRSYVGQDTGSRHSIEVFNPFPPNPPIHRHPDHSLEE